jgi:hypothetical protein
VPHQYVRRLEVLAMQLQHPETGQARNCPSDQASGYGIYRETAPEQQPGQQRGGGGEEEASEKTSNPCGEEVAGLIIPEQQRKQAN